jgi:hypothetical protein
VDSTGRSARMTQSSSTASRLSFVGESFERRSWGGIPGERGLSGVDLSKNGDRLGWSSFSLHQRRGPSARSANELV